MLTRRYPIGLQSFDKIREGNYVYVDKTDLVYNLVNKNDYVFLSRPRRFGKSLLLSTIQAYFEGRRELFKGLRIEAMEKEWKALPVMRIDLSGESYEDSGKLLSKLTSIIALWEKEYGKSEEDKTIATRFSGLIRRIYQKEGKKVIILIDEYDKPLLESLHDEDIHNDVRGKLRGFYSVIKECDEYIRFAMLTGVTKFGHVSVFSGLNNLRDISLDPDYSAICGITSDEMKTVCHEGINDFAASNGIGFEEALNELKKHYDGYHFSFPSPDIFNPFSLFNALESKKISSFWFATGTPTFLIKDIGRMGMPVRDILKAKVKEAVISSADSYRTNPLTVLYQAGYLTIKGYNAKTRYYTLGIPNLEVEEGLYNGILPLSMNQPSIKVDSDMQSLAECLENGDADRFMQTLKGFLADVPYYLSKGKPEIYFENNLYIVMKLLGCTVHAEYATSYGRVDIVLMTTNYVYVMELKLDGSPEDAISQIEDKDYILPFVYRGKQIFKIGVNFSKQTRNIDRWIIKTVK